ncbi:MAG: sensor histidine kinase [Myxococcota bacterium]
MHPGRMLAGFLLQGTGIRVAGWDPLGPADRMAFAAAAARLTTRGLEVTGVVIIALTLAAWPTDWFVFGADKSVFHALVQWRLLVLFVCAVGLAMLRMGRHFAERPLVVAFTIYWVVSAGTGWLMGTAGGLESPLFYGIYTAPLLSVLLVVDLRPRTVVTAGIVLSYLAGFFLADLRHLTHPMIATPVVWLSASAVTVVVVGHVVYLLLRENFLQQVALDRLNRRLEQAVSEQTGEIGQLASNLVTVQEEERTRIAREVHDELGQTLTGLRMEVDRLNRPLTASGNVPPQDRDLGPAMELMDAIHGSIDGILNNLRPGTLATAGLTAAIETLGKRTHREHGVRCNVDIDIDEEELPDDETTAVYRIVQEALTNACRHAQPRTIDISIRGTEQGIVLTVRDDGRGFDVAMTPPRTGFGLLGIRERSRLLGGQCEVSSRLGEGTTVVVRFRAPAGRPGTEVEA